MFFSSPLNKCGQNQFNKSWSVFLTKFIRKESGGNSSRGDIMQTVHKVCLTLTGVCVLILCIGIGIGIGHRVNSDSNAITVEYEAFDEDYVESDIHQGCVICSKEGKKVIRKIILHSDYFVLAKTSLLLWKSFRMY